MRHPNTSRGTAVTPPSNAEEIRSSSTAGRGTTSARATSEQPRDRRDSAGHRERGTTHPLNDSGRGTTTTRAANTGRAHTATRATSVQRVSNAEPSMQLLIRAPPPAAKIREVRAVCSSALSAPACNQDKRGKSYMSERPQRPAYSQSQLWFACMM